MLIISFNTNNNNNLKLSNNLYLLYNNTIFEFINYNISLLLINTNNKYIK